MCLICAELKQNKLTSLEARRNLGELYNNMEKDHIHEVLRLIWDKEDKEEQTKKEEEDYWWLDIGDSD